MEGGQKRTRRGLQVLLPPGHPCRSDASVCRLISEFAGWDVVTGRCARISFVGALHDAWVINEDPAVVTVLTPCGVALSVPRQELDHGALRAYPIDVNPHSLSAATDAWFDAVVEGPRAISVARTLWLSPTVGFEDDDGNEANAQAFVELTPSNKASATLKKAPGARRRRPAGPATSGSIHQRVRLFAPEEDLRHPRGPPRAVYCKFFLPYLRLFKTPDYDGYAREAAAYRLLAQCSPAVGPRCHHSSYHELSGSYAAVLDDCLQWLHWHGTLSETQRDRHTGDMQTIYRETLSGAKRIAACLASLHTRFLVPMAAAHEGKDAEDTCENRRRLRAELVHEQVFERLWLRPMDDPELCDYVRTVYNGQHRAASQERDQEPPSDRMGRRIFADRSTVGSRLTLVHGDLRTEHVLMHPEAKAMPSVLLVDWKRSGIGPIEIDLLQLYLTLPPPTRDTEILAVIDEYIAVSRTLAPEAIYFERDELLGFMRDTCLVLAIGGPCLWNDFGNSCAGYETAHRELCHATGTSPRRSAALAAA